jgi:2,5-diamino-6-(ribosylamino)-4(3H)-pyrimidinone 5'-phosphate reductase
MSLPKVTIFVAVSADCSIDGFPIDLGQFYGLAARIPTDAILAGSGTLLPMDAELPNDDEGCAAPPGHDGPLMVAVDTAGRLPQLHRLRKVPYWRDVACVTSASTTPARSEYLARWNIEEIKAGEAKADLRRALEMLRAKGVVHVRVESGGILNSVLLRDNLVSEVWLLMHPAISPPGGRKALRPEIIGRAVDLKLRSSRKMKGAVLLQYEVNGAPAP